MTAITIGRIDLSDIPSTNLWIMTRNDMMASESHRDCEFNPKSMESIDKAMQCIGCNFEESIDIYNMLSYLV